MIFSCTMAVFRTIYISLHAPQTRNIARHNEHTKDERHKPVKHNKVRQHAPCILITSTISTNVDRQRVCISCSVCFQYGTTKNSTHFTIGMDFRIIRKQALFTTFLSQLIKYAQSCDFPRNAAPIM